MLSESRLKAFLSYRPNLSRLIMICRKHFWKVLSRVVLSLSILQKDELAYKTGNLKNNIKEQKQSMSGGKAQVDVGVTTVPYAARIEFGYTGPDKLGRRFHQAAQPYMRNSLDENGKKIDNIIESKLKAVIARYR